MKTVSKILAALLALSLLFAAGCSEQKPADNNNGGNNNEEPQYQYVCPFHRL